MMKTANGGLAYDNHYYAGDKLYTLQHHCFCDGCAWNVFGGMAMNADAIRLESDLKDAKLWENLVYRASDIDPGNPARVVRQTINKLIDSFKELPANEEPFTLNEMSVMIDIDIEIMKHKARGRA